MPAGARRSPIAAILGGELWAIHILEVTIAKEADMQGSNEPVVGPSTRAPGPDHSPERGRRFAKSARIRIVRDQLKVAEAQSETGDGRFEFFCDEPPALGGEDRFPQPLTYIAAGVGF